MIAAFSAALLGSLTQRLGDAEHAAAVSAGRLGIDPGAEIAALTSSWHLTQVGVGGICLVLSVVIAILLFARSTGPTQTRRDTGAAR